MQDLAWSRMALVAGRYGQALSIYFLTGLLVYGGVVFGMDYMLTTYRHPVAVDNASGDIACRVSAWDGVWYRRIVQDGYSYDSDKMSTVAFFPLYPLSSWLVTRVTGLRGEWGCLVTSNLYLVGAFGLFATYLKDQSTSVQGQALLALGLYPTTFYMRMNYTESSFLFVALLAMFGMQQNWRSPWIALAVGLATASRTVGVSLLLPFAWHLWCEDRNLWRFTRRAAWLLPLGCWGLVGYIVYLWQTFGEPFAFIKTQAHWLEVQEAIPWWRILLAHLTLEPFWQVYVPGCNCYWAEDPPSVALLSMQFFNPTIMLLTWFVIGYGAYQRLITMREGLLSLGLLAIPYLTHTYRCCSASEARYASVVFPFYIVVGHWLSRCPSAVSSLIYVVFSVYLGICSAMFVSWYWFY